MAEFDNSEAYREEKSAMYEVGAKDIIERYCRWSTILREVLAQWQKNKGWFFCDRYGDGLQTDHDNARRSGVKVIEAVGQEFNPDLHNAVMHVEDEEAGENIIVEEFQKGYTYRDSVVRHSMVKVAN